MRIKPYTARHSVSISKLRVVSTAARAFEPIPCEYSLLKEVRDPHTPICALTER